MDTGAEEEFADSSLTKLADQVNWPRAVAAGIVLTLLIQVGEFLFGDVALFQSAVDLLWRFAKGIFITAVITAAIVIWSLAKKADRLAQEADSLRVALSEKLSTAMKAFLDGKGKDLIRGTIAADAMEAFSLGSLGSERRYRLVVDNLRYLSREGPALDPAVTYLIERNIEQIKEDFRTLTNSDSPFVLTGVEQVELSRRAMEAAEHEVHFVDVEPQNDIEVAWSRPFLGYIGEVCANARIRTKRQTIICLSAQAVTHEAARSEYLKKQISYMASKNFDVFLVSKASAKVFSAIDWRFELYDDTAVRIRQQEKYEDEQQLDVTVLPKSNPQLVGILKHIDGNAQEVAVARAGVV